jgi:hypothetical protein
MIVLILILAKLIPSTIVIVLVMVVIRHAAPPLFLVFRYFVPAIVGIRKLEHETHHHVMAVTDNYAHAYL